ncbi:hypothetical protein OG216_08040 [Streptomycetaceae bacterium NBC_01309]
MTGPKPDAPSGQRLTPAERIGAVLRSAGSAEPRADGVLFLDADPAVLGALAQDLVNELNARGKPSRVVVLHPWHKDEDLWSRWGVTGEGFRVDPGLLVEASDDVPVVVVPDLANAGTAVLRAVVTTAGADVAHAESTGRSDRWAPRARWLAGVSREEAARLSPHVLDRFPLRVDAAHLAGGAHKPSWAAPGPGVGPAAHRHAVVGEEAVRRVVEVMPQSPSRRRDIALLRLARHIAVQASAPRVNAEHVDLAAEIIGLVDPDTPSGPDDDSAPEQERQQRESAEDEPAEDDHGGAAAGYDSGLSAESTTEVVPVAAIETDAVRQLDAVTAGPGPEAGMSPFPEDGADALPPVRSLALHGRRTPARARRYGRPAGSVPARDLRDIAVVATLLEAAKFQAVRRRYARGKAAERLGAYPGRLLVSPADLRGHRRRAEATSALVLVLDHSCRHDWDWGPALAPHLRQAYEAGSAVTVVELGHHEAVHDLAAERYRTASLLDPRVLLSFERRPGRATPLAHALDLTAHELRRLLRRGRTGVEDVRLVVLTDGRGNVPLDASLQGYRPRGVGRQGVTDALEGAKVLRSLDRVRSLVIAPELDQYATLPAELAEALAAELVVVRRTAPVRGGPSREGGAR